MSGGQAKAGVSIEANAAGSSREIATRLEVLRNATEAALLQSKDELQRLEAAATQPMRTQAAGPMSMMPGGKKPIGAPGAARPSIAAPPRVIAPPAARPVGAAPARPGLPAIVPRPPSGLAPNLRLPKPPGAPAAPAPPPGGSLVPRPGSLVGRPPMPGAAATASGSKPPVPAVRLAAPALPTVPQTAGAMRRQVQDQVRHEWDVLAARRLVDYLTVEVSHPNPVRGRVLIRGEIHPGTTVGIHRMNLDVNSKVQGRVYFAGDGYVKEAIAAMGHLGG
jgi:hypothetical protein